MWISLVNLKVTKYAIIANGINLSKIYKKITTDHSRHEQKPTFSGQANAVRSYAKRGKCKPDKIKKDLYVYTKQKLKQNKLIFFQYYSNNTCSILFYTHIPQHFAFDVQVILSVSLPSIDEKQSNPPDPFIKMKID